MFGRHKDLGLIPRTATAKNKVLYYFCHIDLISTNDVMGTGRKYRNIIRAMHFGYLLLKGYLITSANNVIFKIGVSSWLIKFLKP